MRLIITLIVIAAAAYIGWTVYQDKLAKQAEPSAETVTDNNTPGNPSAPSMAGDLPKGETSPGVPAEKRIAPPGVYYMLDRVTIEHAAGIAAAIPGEQVKLMQRKGNGIVKVTTGKFDFEVKESQLTNDIDLAQEVERKYAIAHPLKQ